MASTPSIFGPGPSHTDSDVQRDSSARGGRGGRGRSSARGGGDSRQNSGRENGERSAGRDATNQRGGKRGGRGGARGDRTGRGGENVGGSERSSVADAGNTLDKVQDTLQSLQVGSTANKDVSSNKNADGANDEDGEDADESVCFICANPIIYQSLAPCGHSTCHICSLRMRALYGNKACAHCRTESEYVIFAPNDNKKYEDYDDSQIIKTDSALSIKYVTAAIYDDTVVLLRYNCPDLECDVSCMSWRDLHSHVKNAHNKLLCRLCTRNKKVFTHEHTLFTAAELKKHEKQGDDKPGAVDQSGFKGHPECGFCHTRFYSSDELYSHCREAHERCFICDRRNYSQNQQYFLNYDALVVHFQKEHFMCPEQECLEKKFIVFESEIDLNAHQLEVHPHGLSKAAKRDARRIDMSQFVDARPGPSRGRGRGRDPNAELPPARSDQPLRRDEVAFQRQLAVQSSQSTTTRSFGGQLSQPSGPTYAAQPTPAQARAPLPVQTATIGPAAPPVRNPINSTVAFPPLGGRTSTQVPWAPSVSSSQMASSNPSQASSSTQPIQSEDEARKVRHNAVLERASSFLKGDAAKIDEFKRYVSEYRQGVMTARETVDAFWTLFNTSAQNLGGLIRSLAELYDVEKKRTELLAAWNSWRAQNEEYPPIAGSSSGSGAGGARVMRIKQSTTPSARSAGQGAWGSAAVQSSSSAFTQPSIRKAAPATSYASSVTAPQTPTPSVRTYSTTTTGTASSSRKPSAAEFPALPPKKPSHSFGPVIRPSGGRGGVTVNAWAPGGNNGSSSAQPEQPNNEQENNANKKKKGKGKQVLMQFG